MPPRFRRQHQQRCCFTYHCSISYIPALLLLVVVLILLVVLSSTRQSSSFLLQPPAPTIQPQQRHSTTTTTLMGSAVTTTAVASSSSSSSTTTQLAPIRYNQYTTTMNVNTIDDDDEDDDEKEEDARTDKASSNKNSDTLISSISITIPPYLPTMNQTTIITSATTTTTTTSKIPLLSYPSVLHTIHVVPNVLSPDEVRQCLILAQQHAQQTKCWDQPDNVRHLSYPTCDFSIDQCPSLQEYMDHTIQFDERIWNILHTLYNVPYDQMYYLDLFCTQYQAPVVSSSSSSSTTTTTTMDRLQPHRDGSILSFTITLSTPNVDFIGGGTSFDALQNVIPTTTTTTTTNINQNDNTTNGCPNVGIDNNDTLISSTFNTRDGIVSPQHGGDGVFHCGKLLHGGAPIHSGTRIVLVGFVDLLRHDDDVATTTNDDDSYEIDDDEIDDTSTTATSTIVRSGVLHQACRDWGRLDVATYIYERQQQQQQQVRQERKKIRLSTDAATTTKKEEFRSDYNMPLQLNRWIPKSNSSFRKRYPATVLKDCLRRSDIIYQRQRRLQIEDELLRSILLPYVVTNSDTLDNTLVVE